MIVIIYINDTHTLFGCQCATARQDATPRPSIGRRRSTLFFVAGVLTFWRGATKRRNVSAFYREFLRLRSLRRPKPPFKPSPPRPVPPGALGRRSGRGNCDAFQPPPTASISATLVCRRVDSTASAVCSVLS